MTNMKIRRESGRLEWSTFHLDLSEKELDISRIAVPTFPMRIGSAVVKMGGVANVGTDEPYRGRGYARLMVDEALSFFTSSGHDVSVLFGIPDLYHKFGYAPALADTTLTVGIEDSRVVLSEYDMVDHSGRSLKSEDWPFLIDLYDVDNQTRTGTRVRRGGDWTGYRHGTVWNCGTEIMVTENLNGSLTGYVTFDDLGDVCRVGDLAGASTDVFPMLLRLIIEGAERRSVDSFEVALPPDHPFVVFCRQCGGTLQTVYHRNQAGMARIINLHKLFDKITGLLSERLSCSHLAALHGVLEIHTDLGAVTLDIDNGDVQLVAKRATSWSVSLPQVRLIQLIMGYRSVADVGVDDDVQVDPEALPLLDVLFPVGHPWMPLPDHF